MRGFSQLSIPFYSQLTLPIYAAANRLGGGAQTDFVIGRRKSYSYAKVGAESENFVMQ